MKRSTSSLLLALALVALAPVALAGAQHGEEAAHEAPASAGAPGPATTGLTADAPG